MRRRHAALITLCLLVGLLAVPVVLTWREVRQERLNHALIAAVDRNDPAGVRSLLHAGADPNAEVLPDDVRPVWKRIWDLLRHGSVPETVPRGTALAAAIAWNTPDAANYDPIRDYYNRDNADIVMALANAGADVNGSFTRIRTLGSLGTERLQTTPLIEAAYNHKWKVVQVLLAYDADVKATDSCSDTTLMYATSDCKTVMVETLVKRGAEVNAMDDYGETALFWIFDDREPHRHDLMSSDHSFYSPSNAILTFLLRSGASVNGTNHDGKRILWLAHWYGDEQSFQILQQAGAKE